jgi:hypothetical protein
MNSNFDMWYNLKLFFSNMFSLMMYYVLLVVGIIVVGYISLFIINLVLTWNKVISIIVV